MPQAPQASISQHDPKPYARLIVVRKASRTPLLVRGTESMTETLEAVGRAFGLKPGPKPISLTTVHRGVDVKLSAEAWPVLLGQGGSTRVFDLHPDLPLLREPLGVVAKNSLVFDWHRWHVVIKTVGPAGGKHVLRSSLSVARKLILASGSPKYDRVRSQEAVGRAGRHRVRRRTIVADADSAE